MQVITSNQQLENNRKYLCRNKRPFESGGYSKPELKRVDMSRECSGYPLRRLGGFWAYDKADKIISYDGMLRIAISADRTYADVEKAISEKPFQDQYYGVQVEDADYTDSSQALDQWDVIGPIPEIREEVLHALFEYPLLIELFNRPVSLQPDGDISVLINEGDEITHEVWHSISDQEDLKEVITILEDQEKPFKLNPEQMVAAPEVWSGDKLACSICSEEIILNVPRLGSNGGFVHKDTGKIECASDDGTEDEQITPILADNLDKEFVESLGRLEHLQTEHIDEEVTDHGIDVSNLIFNDTFPIACIFCKHEVILESSLDDRVERYVHKDTSITECSQELTTDVNGPDKHGFVTTESCGSKIDKKIILTERKHNQFGYYITGSILTIMSFNNTTGYVAGIPAPDHASTFLNVVNVGFDGFEFVD